MADSLFDLIECPVCRSALWRQQGADRTCGRCSYVARRDGSLIHLLPERLSANNARESEAGPEQVESGFAASELRKPFDYPASFQMFYRDSATLMRRAAQGLGADASVLFTCVGCGMEPHLSGLSGANVVLSDISAGALRVAERRFQLYGVPQPRAFVVCDAESLPFKDQSFDLVIAAFGIHHCLVPQAALREVLRVARRRSLIIDNYECAMTRVLNRFGMSSNIEHSGVLPNRFTRTALSTMLFNAGVSNYRFRPLALSPGGVARRLGTAMTRSLESVLGTIGQSNMFLLVTSRDNEDLQALLHAPLPVYDPNPSRRLPDGTPHAWPA